MSLAFDWHQRAARYILDRKQPRFVIHSLYNPNQMLTARWWLGKVDPSSRHFAGASEVQRRRAQGDVLAMYQRVDAIVGEYLDRRRPGDIVVFSADHGIAPVDRLVRVNHLLATAGLLALQPAEEGQQAGIQWHASQAVFIDSCHVFINPAGLAGPYAPGAGPAYERLRDRVIAVLRATTDVDGRHPFSRVLRREEAVAELFLPGDRIGDVVVAVRPGFGLTEELASGAPEPIVTPLFQGGKQAVDPALGTFLWTPFLMVGPGIRQGVTLGEPVQHPDQLPTLLRAIGAPAPAHLDGRVLEEIFQ
jgi:arylsulfatase A-like enzyme